jgi:hypothetical protein
MQRPSPRFLSSLAPTSVDIALPSPSGDGDGSPRSPAPGTSLMWSRMRQGMVKMVRRVAMARRFAPHLFPALGGGGGSVSAGLTPRASQQALTPRSSGRCYGGRGLHIVGAVAESEAHRGQWRRCCGQGTLRAHWW